MVKSNFLLEPWTGAWPTEEGPWILRLDWSGGPAGIECTGIALTLMPGQPVRPLTATLLRQLRVQDEIRRARGQIARERGGDLVEAYEEAVAGDPVNAHLLEELNPQAVDEIRKAADAWSPPRPTGRPLQYDRAHYVEVARVYSEAAARRQPPTQAVKIHLMVSQATASRHVNRARELGLLPEARNGLTSANTDLISTREES